LPVVGVLDAPYSAKPYQLCSNTSPPGYYRMDTVPAYVDWREPVRLLR
jgi:hypothetical protein